MFSNDNNRQIEIVVKQKKGPPKVNSLDRPTRNDSSSYTMRDRYARRVLEEAELREEQKRKEEQYKLQTQARRLEKELQYFRDHLPPEQRKLLRQSKVPSDTESLKAWIQQTSILIGAVKSEIQRLRDEEAARDKALRIEKLGSKMESEGFNFTAMTDLIHSVREDPNTPISPETSYFIRLMAKEGLISPNDAKLVDRIETEQANREYRRKQREERFEQKLEDLDEEQDRWFRSYSKYEEWILVSKQYGSSTKKAHREGQDNNYRKLERKEARQLRQ